MNKEEFDKLKEDYINNILDYVKSEGGLFAHISIFAKEKENSNEKPALIHVPLSDNIMEDDEGKDLFIEKILPRLAETITEKFNVFGVAWSSEAWMRVANKEEEVEDFSLLPIDKEVIFITIESVNHDAECIMYEINRNGVSVNEDGDLVDVISLTKSDIDNTVKMSGRFSNLLKYFKKENDD
jgi:hypothetical protein